MGEGSVFHDVPDEHLPFQPERVAGLPVEWSRLPLPGKPVITGDIGVPDGSRRDAPVLGHAIAQAGDRAALGAVDVQLEELAAVDARAPGGVHRGDDAAGQLEDRVSGVVGGGRVRLALLVPAARDVRDRLRGHRLDTPEEALQDVRPVREHVEHDAAAVLLAVIPGGPLRGTPVAFEHPVAELAAHGQDPAEEAAVDQGLQRPDAGQEKLVLHDPGPHACPRRRVRQPGGFPAGTGDRLLDVDVRTFSDSFRNGRVAGARHLRVEVDAAVRRGVQGVVEARGPRGDAVALRDLGELGLAAPDEDRLQPDLAAVRQRDPAVGVDREHRPHQVLVVAHPPGDAVHGHPDRAFAWASLDVHSCHHRTG